MLMYGDRIHQPDIVDYARQAIANGRMPHTILLNGANGYGLWDTSMHLTKLLACEETIEKRPCLRCDQCRKIDNLIHPDVHQYFPTTDPKSNCAEQMNLYRDFRKQNATGDFSQWLHFIGTPDKRLNIYQSIIDQIIDDFQFKSHLGGVRVYIIWGAEYLGKEGNKLLKIIEEPPDESYIFLLSENRKLILPTIQSRAQVLLLKPLSTSTLLSLSDKDESDENIALALQADGNINKLHSYEMKDFAELQEAWIQLYRLAYTGRPLQLIVAAEDLGDRSRDYNINFYRYGIEFLRNILLTGLNIPSDAHDGLRRLSNLMTIDDVQTILTRLQSDIIHIERNANLKILATSFVLFLASKLAEIKKSVVKV